MWCSLKSNWEDCGTFWTRTMTKTTTAATAGRTGYATKERILRGVFTAATAFVFRFRNRGRARNSIRFFVCLGFFVFVFFCVVGSWGCNTAR